MAEIINPTDNTGTTPVSQLQPTPQVANPDGNTITTPQSPQPTNVINEVNPWQITPLPKEVVPLAETKDTTNTDISSTNVIGAAENQANLAASEKTSQLDLTQELNAVDVNQANTKIANANANIAELTAIEKQQQLDKTNNELKYQEDLRKNQEEEIASLKVQQASELVKNDAEAAELKAKQDKAERDAETANEVALMQSNVAFAKLGGSFSGAAINTAQKLFTDGAYNIASLKSSNAYNYASLKVKINTVAFEHTQAIGKLVQEVAEKEFASKERLREFIGSSQKNILLGKKEAQNAIQDAITTYKNEKQSREDKLYSDMNSANTRLQSATETIQKQVTAEETTSKSKIDLMVLNWQWSKLTPAQQNDYEDKAWLPIGSTSKSVITTATQFINDSVKELAGKAVTIPNATLALMQTEIKRSMDLWIWLKQATQMALDKYKNRIPELTNALALQKTKAMNEAEKAYAEIEKTKSETVLNAAKAEKERADAVKAKAQAAAAGKTWKSSTSFTPIAFKDWNGTLVQWTFEKTTWTYRDSNWLQVTNASAIYHPSAWELQAEANNIALANYNKTNVNNWWIAWTWIPYVDYSNLNNWGSDQ